MLDWETLEGKVLAKHKEFVELKKEQKKYFNQFRPRLENEPFAMRVIEDAIKHWAQKMKDVLARKGQPEDYLQGL